VKVAKTSQGMRLDVPVVGLKAIEVTQRAGATCLAVDAGRCLLLGHSVRVHMLSTFGTSEQW